MNKKLCITTIIIAFTVAHSAAGSASVETNAAKIARLKTQTETCERTLQVVLSLKEVREGDKFLRDMDASLQNANSQSVFFSSLPAKVWCPLLLQRDKLRFSASQAELYKTMYEESQTEINRLKAMLSSRNNNQQVSNSDKK